MLPLQTPIHYILIAMKKIILFVICSLFWFLYVVGQIPAGYYDAAAGKSGANLKTVLYNIVKDHTIKSYDYVWTAFHTTDIKQNGKVWDMYTDIPGGTPVYEFTIGSGQCGSGGGGVEGDCYSREHSFPKSWFGGEVSPMYTDIFHLYPTDQYVNGRRNDNPYGKVDSPTWTSSNGSKLGHCATPGFTGTVFEPIDDYKGDLARTYFYMATRYENVIDTWQNNNPGDTAILDGTSFPVFKTWYLQMLLSWNSQDRVSQKEIDRNEAVYLIQHNRNPYIDHPEYVNLIWGNPIGLPEEENYILSVYPNPVADECFIRLPAGISYLNSNVTLFSMTGEKIKPMLSFGEHKISLNLQGLAKGVYYLQLTNTKNSLYYHAKLMKE